MVEDGCGEYYFPYCNIAGHLIQALIRLLPGMGAEAGIWVSAGGYNWRPEMAPGAAESPCLGFHSVTLCFLLSLAPVCFSDSETTVNSSRSKVCLVAHKPTMQTSSESGGAREAWGKSLVGPKVTREAVRAGSSRLEMLLSLLWGWGEVRAPRCLGCRPTTEGVRGIRVGDPKTWACVHASILDPQAHCTMRGEGVLAVSPAPWLRTALQGHREDCRAGGVPVSEGPCHPWAAYPGAAPCCFTGRTSACTTCSWEGPGKFPESLRLLSTTAIPSAGFSLAGLPGSSVTTLTHIGPGAAHAADFPLLSSGLLAVSFLTSWTLPRGWRCPVHPFSWLLGISSRIVPLLGFGV